MERNASGVAVSPARSARILIVDDEAAMLRVLRASLEAHGFVVCGEAENGNQAIGQAVESQPDLVILDLAMPGLNGVEVAATLQRLLPKVPILLFTIYGDHVGEHLGSFFGIKAIVSKSDGMTKVLETVNSLLKSKYAKSAGN
jgi:DNA-binding NarL/FixJ family response regulator